MIWFMYYIYICVCDVNLKTGEVARSFWRIFCDWVVDWTLFVGGKEVGLF
jgi:hypothetical protein